MDWTLNEFAREDVIKTLFSSDVVLQIDPEKDGEEPLVIEITEKNEGELFEKYGNYFVFEVRPSIAEIKKEDYDEELGHISVDLHLVMKIELTKESVAEKYEREDVPEDYGEQQH